MKWSLQQLLKIQKFPYHFEEVLDLSEEAKAISDIFEMKPVSITGKINRLDDQTYEFSYHIHVLLVLECALTLEPCEYTFEGDYVDICSTNPDDDMIQIEKNTIDTRMLVWSNFIIDKPINVTRPDAYEILKSRGIQLNEEPILDLDDEIISYSDGIMNDETDE